MKSESADSSQPTKPTRFTLRELLAVIAILAILMTISIVSIGSQWDWGRRTVVQTEVNAKNLVNALSEFAARKENVKGYPPGYGYILHESSDTDHASLVDTDHMLEPFTVTVGLHEVTDFYQVLRFADSFDNNRDGALSLMEYLPIGDKDPATNAFEFSDVLYTGGNKPMTPGGLNEVAIQLEERARPFVYVPYNNRQLATARNYWVTAGEINTEADSKGLEAASFDTGENSILYGRMHFPPKMYDGFVLIGNGLGGKDGGLTSIPAPGTPGIDYDARHIYHVLSLRIAFLATLDQNGDGKKDFDFRARKHSDTQILLPDGSNGWGPFLLVQ